MNELELPNDINQIELEIQWHKENTGRSIWEIGRRLNHVKENDLAHGQFGTWLESINISHDQANKMMRIASDLNSESTRNLGVEALYLIATLPDEQKENELKKAEEGEPSTTRELKELKKQINEKDKLIDQLDKANSQLADENERLGKPEIIEKEVIKEVVPEDYEELKSSNQQLSNALREANRSHDLMQEQYNNLVSQQKEEDENSQKYKELNQAIREMQGKMDRTQKLIRAQKQVYELVDMSKELLMKITPIPYLIDSELVRENPVAKRELENIANQTQSFLNNLNDALKESRIMEGEFTNAE